MLIVKGGEKLEPPKVLPTPSFGLNYVLNGGIWTDRITTLWGSPGSGKSTFALHLMAQSQDEGYIPVIVDTETSHTDDWLERCGIDLQKRIVMRSTIVEEISKELCPLMKKPEQKYIFLVDSISGIIFESANKDDAAGKAIGGHARAQKWLTNKLSSYIHPNICIIYVAQMAMAGLGTNYPYAKANLGYYVEHYSTNIIKMFKNGGKSDTERDEDTDRILNQRVTWTIDKCRQTGADGTKGDYWFNKTICSIDKREELFHIAKRVGIIEGTTWLSYKGNKYHGKDKLFADLTDGDWTTIEDSLAGISDINFDKEEYVGEDN